MACLKSLKQGAGTPLWYKYPSLICRNATKSWIWWIPPVFLMAVQLWPCCYSWPVSPESYPQPGVQIGRDRSGVWRVCLSAWMRAPPLSGVYPIYSKGEPDPVKYRAWSGPRSLVSLGMLCLSLPHVPQILKAENYPHAHTHLEKERKLPTDFQTLHVAVVEQEKYKKKRCVGCFFRCLDPLWAFRPLSGWLQNSMFLIYKFMSAVFNA